MLLLFSLFLNETFWPFFILSVICFVAATHFNKKLSAQEGELTEIGGWGNGAPNRLRKLALTHLQMAEDKEGSKLSRHGKCD